MWSVFGGVLVGAETFRAFQEEEEEEEEWLRVGMPGPDREAILRLFPKPGDWKLQAGFRGCPMMGTGLWAGREP